LSKIVWICGGHSHDASSKSWAHWAFRRHAWREDGDIGGPQLLALARRRVEGRARRKRDRERHGRPDGDVTCQMRPRNHPDEQKPLSKTVWICGGHSHDASSKSWAHWAFRRHARGEDGDVGGRQLLALSRRRVESRPRRKRDGERHGRPDGDVTCQMRPDKCRFG